MGISKHKQAALALVVWILSAVCGVAQADSLSESLKAENVEVRRKASAEIRTADRKVQIEALPAMIDRLMTEKDGQVRLAVLDALTAMGPDASPAVDALAHTLRTNYGGQGREESHQDFRSALALASIGKPAVETLRELLKERKESVRAEVVMALGRIGADADAAVPDLTPLLGDPSDRIRRETVLALGKIGEAAVGPLIAASSNESALIRAQAVDSLGGADVPKDRVLTTVMDRSHDPAPEVRAAAIRALTKLGPSDDSALSVIAENLRGEDEQVRLAVIDWLVDRPSLLPRTAEDLESLLSAENEGVARHAAFLLGRIGPDAAPRLLHALADEKSRIEPIAEALAHIGRPIVETLTRSLEAPEPRVRRAAALALGQVRPLAPGVVQKLTAGLSDPDAEVKAAFLTAIGGLGPQAAEALPAARALLKDESADLRSQTVAVLARSAPRDARFADDLIGLLQDPEVRVQRQAIDVLRSLGPLGRKALPIVIEKLASPDAETRTAAAEMIGSHGPAAAEALPSLTLLLADPSPELQTIAAQTLGKLARAAQPALDPLTSLLDSEHIKVREAAALALGSLELDAEAVRPRLVKALRDPTTEVRRAAMRTIQRFGPQGVLFLPDLILMAENKDDVAFIERALKRYERRGPDARSIPELINQLTHKQDAVRLLAINFLSLAGPKAQDALPTLERLGEDPNAEIRKQAEAACKQIKSPPSPTAEAA